MEKNIEDIKTLPVVETLNRIIQEYYSFMAWAHYTNLEDNEETVSLIDKLIGGKVIKPMSCAFLTEDNRIESAPRLDIAPIDLFHDTFCIMKLVNPHLYKYFNKEYNNVEGEIEWIAEVDEEGYKEYLKNLSIDVPISSIEDTIFNGIYALFKQLEYINITQEGEEEDEHLFCYKYTGLREVTPNTNVRYYYFNNGIGATLYTTNHIKDGKQKEDYLCEAFVHENGVYKADAKKETGIVTDSPIRVVEFLAKLEGLKGPLLDSLINTILMNGGITIEEK